MVSGQAATRHILRVHAAQLLRGGANCRRLSNIRCLPVTGSVKRMAWNTAHDVRLPGAQAGAVNFLMYPVAETSAGRLDSYAPDAFKYIITATEVKA